MSIGVSSKPPDSGRNHDGSDVMLATLAEQPIYTKIGRVKIGPGGGAGVLQLVDLLGRRCEVVWEDDMCVSE